MNAYAEETSDGAALIVVCPRTGRVTIHEEGRP